MKNSNLKVFLFIFSFLLYLNSLFGNFVFDDRKTVLANFDITKLANIPKFFISPYFQNKPQSGIYRPLIMVTYAIDHLWFKTNSAFFFHLTNILLHSTNAVLVFMLIKKLSKDKKLAFFTALLFASHPINTEAVSWISGRPELLAFLFSLLSILNFLKNNWLKTNIFLLLALFSKETAIVLIPLYIYLFFSSKKLKQSLNLNSVYCLLFTVYIYFSFRWLALGKFIFSNDATIVENPLKYAPFLPRIFTALKIFTLYLVKFVFPLKLSADYSYNQIPILNSPFHTLTIFGFLFILAAIAWLIKKKTAIILRLSLFFLLFPYLLVSNLILPIGTIMGERLMYFPSLGFCLISGFFFLKLYSFCHSRTPHLTGIWNLLTITIISLYFLRTFLRNLDWQNEFKLYTSMAKASPNSILARSNLGGMHIVNKDWAKAKKELLTANNVCECYPHAANNLGLVYQHEENLEKAEKWFKKAIEIDPNYQLGYKNLGILYFNQAKFKEAKIQFKKILPGNENNQEVIYWINKINKKIIN